MHFKFSLVKACTQTVLMGASPCLPSITFLQGVKSPPYHGYHVYQVCRQLGYYIQAYQTILGSAYIVPFKEWYSVPRIGPQILQCALVS